MRLTLLMLGCAMLLPVLAVAGEKAFMSGTVRLINKPFSIIKPYLGNPAQTLIRDAKPNEWIDWGDGEKNMFHEGGTYTQYRYVPVRLVPDDARSARRSGPAFAQTLHEYACLLTVTVGPDENIRLIGRQGSDCNFDLSRYLK